MSQFEPMHTEESWQPLCASTELLDSSQAVAFDVLFQGQACRAFAVRFQGEVRAYLNRCSHVAMEMDWVPNRFFSRDGQWLICATHGAMHHPLTGACVGGPCSSGLIQIQVLESSGQVHWQPQFDLQPLWL